VVVGIGYSPAKENQILPSFYVPCPPTLTEVSSSRVRELIELKRSIDVLKQYILPAVAQLTGKEI